VFPEGTPGVPQGVPQELVKGYQPPAEPDPQAQAAVDQATAESLFSLSDGSNTVAGTFSWPDDHTMVFQPAAALARGVHYTASAAGAAAPAKATTWGFTVVDYPRVTSTDPANGDTSARLGGVSITFSAPMDHDSTEAAITFDPQPDPDNAPDFFWSGADTVLNINLHTEYSSSYRVSIGAGATVNILGSVVDWNDGAGVVDLVVRKPRHPCTQLLISSVPEAAPARPGGAVEARNGRI